MDLDQAMKEFWKHNSVSSYASNYGQYTEDKAVNKYKQLSQYPPSSILKTEIRDMIEHWLSNNAVEDFTNRIVNTLREMYTFVKSEEFPLSTKEVTHQWMKHDDFLTAPRLDKLIEKHRY